MPELTQISLFTGCGGIDLAFERAGFKSLLQCEIDKHARAVLERHWPDVERIDDVRSVVIPRESASENEHVKDQLPADNGRRETRAGLPGGPTVIHFGSPCQDLSVAGKRRGFAGERSGLYTEAIRIIRERRPTFAIWENVPGAFSSNYGRDFGHALDLLASAGALDITWRVLDAQWFGVPQRRRRVFVVADFRGHRAHEILFEREGEERDPPPSREAGEVIAASLRSRSASPGVNMPGRGGEDDSNLVIADLLTVGANQYSGFNGEPVYAVRTAQTSANGHGVAVDVAHTLDGASQAIADPNEPIAFMAGAGAGAGSTGAGEISPTLKSGDSGSNRVSSVAFPFTGRQRLKGADHETYVPAIAGTLSNGAHSGGGLNGQDAYSGRVLAPSTGVRRLTPTECERLQGFPDGWTEFAADGSTISDSQRFKMLGNAVAVPVLEWIANRMAAVQGYERA